MIKCAECSKEWEKPEYMTGAYHINHQEVCHPCWSKDQQYIPSKEAIEQRKYSVIKTTNKCHSAMCIKQRENSIISNKLKFKYYRPCSKCKTNWPKEMLVCPCCGKLLRRAPRDKKNHRRNYKK